MPSFLTRSPRGAASPTVPSPQPEDDQRDPVASAAAGVPIGTTGGVIPQQAGTWDRPPQGQLSADPGVRRQQSIDQAEAAFAEKQRQDNPFIFSNDIRKLADVGGREYINAAVQSGERQYAQQQAEQRQQQAADVAAYNSKAEAQFRARGQQYYQDPESRRLVPVVDEQGRALYHPQNLGVQMHPKTGMPVGVTIDKFGQRQYNELPVVGSENPLDSDMYYLNRKTGETYRAGSIEDMLNHPSYNVRKQALAANTKRSRALIQQTVAPLKELSETAQNEYQDAQNNRDALAQQIQQANQLAEETVGNDAQSASYRATAAQLQTKLDALNQQLSPKGELYARKNAAARDYAMARRNSVLNVYQAQGMEMAARLKAEGKDPATDPAFQANQHMIDQIQAQGGPVQQAQAPGAPAQAPQAGAPEAQAPLADAIEPYAMAQRGEKSVGGVSLQQIAQRFGNGQGEVSPDSLLRLNDRMQQIDATLNDPNTKISGKLRQSLQAQRDYLGNLYDSRFGRLPEDAQGRVKGAVDEANKQATKGALAQFLSGAHEEGAAPTANVPRVPEGAFAQFGQPGEIAEGVTNSLGKAVSGLTSKENLALMIGTAGAGKVVQRLLAGGFGVQMLNDARKAAPEVWKKLNDPNVAASDKAEAVGDLVTNLVLGTVAAKHALKGAPAGTKLTPEQAEKAFQELNNKFTPRNEPQKTAAQAAQDIANPPLSGRSAEDVAGIFERNPPQVDEGQPPAKSAAQSAEALKAVPATEYAPGELRPSSAEEAARVLAGEVPQVPPERAAAKPAAESAEALQAAEQSTERPATASAQAIEEGLTREERLRQSGQGAEALKGQLQQEREFAPPERPQAELAADRRAYDAVQAKMKALTDAQGMDAVSSPEYQRLWQASETIKNRNGGYVPEPAKAKSPEQMTPDEFADNYETSVKGGNLRAAFRIGNKLIEGGPEVKTHGQMYQPEWGNNAEPTFTWKGKELDTKKINAAESGTQEIHRQSIEMAIKEGDPVSSEAVKSYGIELPAEYKKQGDVYVKKEQPSNAIQERSTTPLGQQPGGPQGIGREGGQGVEPSQQGTPPAGAKAQPEAVQQAPVEERPLTAEARKNNADIGQKPVSSLTRAEKRAELDAAGIKEYNGKPLDDINPAELSAAVGKLRRGELTPESKLTTDKIIENLQSMKKGKLPPGAAGLISPNEGGRALTPGEKARDFAIDLATLGVRAGRPLEQVVRLAIDHYKARNEGWTKDDITSLEGDIRKALGAKSPEKSAISSVTEKLEKAIGKSGDPALRDEIAARRDAGDNIAGIRATEARSEISAALDKIAPETKAQKAARFFNVPTTWEKGDKLPSRARTERDTADDALRFYIESDNGNAAKLDAMRDKIANSDKADPKWAKQALEAIDYAKKNGAKLAEAARAVRQYMGDQLTAESQVNLPVLERKNYVPRYQDVEESGILEPKGGKGGGVDSHKVRQYETMADSIAAGVDPKTLSVIDSVTNRVDNGMRAVGIRNFYDTLKDAKTENGEPMMVKPEETKRADGSVIYDAPKGYEKIDTPTGLMAVKKEYAELVKDLTSPSFFSSGRGVRALSKAAAAAKTTTLLLDTFHLGRIAMQAAGLNASHPEGWKLGPRFSEGLTIYEHSPRELAKMAESGEIPKDKLGEVLQNKKILEQGIEAGYNTGRVADAIHQDFLHSIPGFGGVNKFIFQQFQRGAMSDAFIMEFKRAKAANPSMPDAQVARNVAKDLNTRFGNIGRQGWIKSATGRDIARLMFLAPQWNEGLIKSEVGGVKQLAQGAANLAQGKSANIGTLGRSFATMALGTFAAAQILNYATRGKPTWENPEEGWESKISAWIPDKIGGSAGFFFNPLGVTAETAHLLAKGYERSEGGHTAKVAGSAGDYLRSRESAVARPADTLITRRDSLGRPIKPDDLPKEIAKSAIPAPISGGSAVRVAKGLATGGKTEEFPGEFQKQAMQSFGVRTDKAPTPEQRIQNLAQEFLSGRGKSSGGGQHEVGDFSPLTAAIRRNNPDDVKSEISSLLEKRSADDLEKYYKQWMNKPFAGSHKLEQDFIRTLNQEQRQQYANARAERKKVGEAALRAIRQIPSTERAGPFKLPK